MAESYTERPTPKTLGSESDKHLELSLQLSNLPCRWGGASLHAMPPFVAYATAVLCGLFKTPLGNRHASRGSTELRKPFPQTSLGPTAAGARAEASECNCSLRISKCRGGVLSFGLEAQHLLVVTATGVDRGAASLQRNTQTMSLEALMAVWNMDMTSARKSRKSPND